MARTNEYLQYKKYSNFEQQLKEIKMAQLSDNEKFAKTHEVYKKMFKFGSQIKQRYALTDHKFGIWLLANKEYLKTLSKNSQQTLNNLEQAYYDNCDNDDFGTDELQALFSFLERTDYTKFINTFTNDFSITA